MSKIIFKKSSVVNKVPQPADLEYGEVALNYADGKLYYKTSTNTIDFLGSQTLANVLMMFCKFHQLCKLIQCLNHLL